eukprot:1160117-Pelagomonas_calceolata.AAC.6
MRPLIPSVPLYKERADAGRGRSCGGNAAHLRSCCAFQSLLCRYARSVRTAAGAAAAGGNTAHLGS